MKMKRLWVLTLLLIMIGLIAVPGEVMAAEIGLKSEEELSDEVEEFTDSEEGESDTVTDGTNDKKKVLAEGKQGEGVCKWILYEDGEFVISGKSVPWYSRGSAPWYQYHNKISKIIIEEGIGDIGSGAFYGCDSILEVEFANTVTSIEYDAFRNCTNLKEIRLPRNLTSMGDNVFRECKNLEKVVIPESLTYIAPRVFMGCSSLEYIKLPKSIKTIGESAFENCSNLKQIQLPEGINWILVSTFYNCKKLYGVYIPQSVEVIETNAFGACESLRHIQIPKNVKYIDNLVFDGCKSLETVEILGNLKRIGSNTFYSCSNLEIIRYGGSSEEWNNFKVGVNDDVKIYCDYNMYHNHVYEKKIIISATCIQKGIVENVCKLCGESYTEEIPALGHTYTSEVIPPSINEKGYTIYTCANCGDSYKDNYTDALEIGEDGFIYSDVLPEYVTEDLFQIEYKFYYEQNATTSPGADWKQGEVVSEKWIDKGAAYNTMTEYPTSSERVFLSARYFHFCGSNTNDAGNYYQTDKFVHYDEIDADAVTANIVEYDEEHPVYFVYLNGTQLFCQSGITCDDSYGSHEQRCKVWYKEYTYINRERVVTYKYTKETNYIHTYDEAATKVSYRFKPTNPSVRIMTISFDKNETTVQACYEVYGIFSEYYTTVAHGFILDNKEEVRYTEFNEEGCYTLELKEGQKTSVRAFLTYKNANGKEITIYSDTLLF